MSFGTIETKEPKMMKEGDDRHYCWKCNRMIRVGHITKPL